MKPTLRMNGRKYVTMHIRKDLSLEDFVTIGLRYFDENYADVLTDLDVEDCVSISQIDVDKVFPSKKNFVMFLRDYISDNSMTKIYDDYHYFCDYNGIDSNEVQSTIMAKIEVRILHWFPQWK